MAVNVALTHKIYVGQHDLSGDHAKVAIEDGVTELDAMVFNNTAKNAQAGTWEPKFSGEGYVTLGTGNVHESLRSNLAVANVPVTVSPESGAVGDVAIFMKALQAKYNVGGPVNTILPFTVEASAQGLPSISGKVFVAAGDKTATGTSSVIELGAVASGKRVYAALHVLSASGTAPTLDVTVKSDDASGFLSGATRLTFTQATAATSEWMQADGAITDTHWRVDYTLGGTSPSFSFVVVVGIF